MHHSSLQHGAPPLRRPLEKTLIMTMLLWHDFLGRLPVPCQAWYGHRFDGTVGCHLDLKCNHDWVSWDIWSHQNDLTVGNVLCNCDEAQERRKREGERKAVLGVLQILVTSRSNAGGSECRVCLYVDMMSRSCTFCSLNFVYVFAGQCHRLIIEKSVTVKQIIVIEEHGLFLILGSKLQYLHIMLPILCIV